MASAEGGQNELPQILSLSHVDVVLHADVVSVHLVARDVSEQLRQVQPPEELDWGVSRSEAREGELAQVVYVDAPARDRTRHNILPVIVHLDGTLQELA